MHPIESIIQFNVDRNLNYFESSTEYAMLFEELQEFMVASSKGNAYDMVDALCDIVVVAVGGLHKLGYDPTAALEETLKEITSRQGALNKSTGKWEKDPKQDPSTLYRASYKEAKG